VSAEEARQKQRCALVTVASRGIGAAIARALATDEWSVAVNYRADAEGAGTVVEGISAGGGEALEVQADVADESSVQRMFDTDFIPDSLRSEEATRVLPARRLGQPEEVAAMASFLVSEEAGYISGTVITMDGGFTAGLGTGGHYWRPKAQTSSDA
jgi:NAD(P)-dependent dehydrogenase (short-subunit alcohol dehydrogenase family)